VSWGFKSAAESDTVWERFLPPDYKEKISESSSAVSSSNKKELYFLLCDSGLLLDGGKLNFRLSRSTGKKCYMLCARQLQIAWKDAPTYWKWTSLPESRFAEVAELLSVCWLDICGTVPAQLLSPNTNYAAYLVFKLSDDHYGLDCSSKALVKCVGESTTESEGKISTVYVVPPTHWRDGRRTRADGWMEIELGEHYIAEGDDDNVQCGLFETESLNWKGGLIVEGIELRPKEVLGSSGTSASLEISHIF
jgi:hypothetical protein